MKHKSTQRKKGGKQKNRLLNTENNLLITRGEGGGMGEVDERD